MSDDESAWLDQQQIFIEYEDGRDEYLELFRNEVVILVVESFLVLNIQGRGGAW